VFGVEAGKFLGFLLTEWGIEANPDKCMTIIGMRSPDSMKEVQQLTEHMVALSRFLSASGDKRYPYFQCFKKNNRFVWTHECEEAFTRLKEFLANPHVLCKSLSSTLTRLYFTVTDRKINSVIVQEQDRVQKLVYFMSKVLQGLETRYQVNEKAALAVIFIARQLRHYFQIFTVIVMIDLPILKFLQKPHIAGHMVCWAIDFSEFNVQYEPRGPIKS